MRQPIQVAVYPVRIINGVREYLMLLRTPSEGGFWQGVTGGVEDDEDITTAALRELQEETGFTPITFRQIHYTCRFPVPDIMKRHFDSDVTELIEYSFLAIIDKQIEPVLDPIEHVEFKWCRFEDALKLLYWPENAKELNRCEQILSEGI